MRTRLFAGWAVWAAGFARAWAQGSLTPPGAPGPVMKTLTQVEPRTPISSLPFSISQPGSYYVTTNLSATGHGITIVASGVTLDLMGFTLSGDHGSTDYGVFIDGGTNAFVRDVVVRNGIIRNFGHGVRVEYGQGCRFEYLAASSNAYYGIYFYGSSGGRCNGNLIAHCTINANHTSGIYFYSGSGQCDGNSIADCAVSGNDISGIVLFGAYGRCNGNTIARCAISGNGEIGVSLNSNPYGESDNNAVTDCVISGSGNQGVYLNGNQGQCNGNTVSGCTIGGNGNEGIHLYGYAGECNGNTVAGCTVKGNGDYGIHVYGNSGQSEGNAVISCTVRGNANRGISLSQADGNRVEGNHVTGQTGGAAYGIITEDTTANLILRNTCFGQATNFAINASDTCGPIVTTAGTLGTTGVGSHPWANFSR